MKNIVHVLSCALLAACASVSEKSPEPAPRSKESTWLQLLVGEWTASSEATMEPGAEPMRMESTESVRAIGSQWIQAEGSASFDGQPFTSIMTLGYDADERAFVGTWIDTMQAHMWVYRGSLDASGKVLMLDTEGPSFDDPTKTARYRDAIEIKSANEKVLTSSVLGDDGEWTTFVRAQYRRRR